MATERKKGDKGAPRTELVAVRFDPRTKFALDVASRIQRRSIANYVEAAVAESFKVTRDTDGSSVDELCAFLWDISEPLRLGRLAKTRSHLLTFDEQKLVKVAASVSICLGFKGSDVAMAEAIQPYWDYLKEAVASDTPFDKVIESVRLQHAGGLVTVERIDKRIDDLKAKLKEDLEWLQGERKRIQAAAKG